MLSFAAIGRDSLALGVAAYGAVVATGVAVYQLVRDRSGVKIILTPVASFAEDRAPVEFWAIRVVNHKPRPITIQSVGLLVEKRRGVGMLSAPYLDQWGSPIDSPFPVTLTAGVGVLLRCWHRRRFSLPEDGTSSFRTPEKRG